MIRFTCSACGRNLSTPDGSAGRRGNCPRCGEEIVVPLRSTRPQRPADLPPRPARERAPSPASQALPAGNRGRAVGLLGALGALAGAVGLAVWLLVGSGGEGRQDAPAGSRTAPSMRPAGGNGGPGPAAEPVGSPPRPGGGKPAGETAPFHGHKGRVNGLAFTRDGRGLLSCGEDSTIRLWDVATGREVRRFEGHVLAVNDLSLSPDGRTFVTAGRDGTARLWEISSGREVRRLHWEKAPDIGLRPSSSRVPMGAVVFAPDGKTVFVGADDGYLRRYDTASGRMITAYPGPSGPIHSLALARMDGTLVVFGGTQNGPYLWHADNPNQNGLVKRRQGSCSGLAVSPVDATVAFTSRDPRSWVRAVRFGPETRERDFAVRAPKNAVAFSPDGKYLAVGGFSPSIEVVDLHSGAVVKTCPYPPKVVVWCLAVSPDSRRLAAGSNDGAIRLWPMPGGGGSGPAVSTAGARLPRPEGMPSGLTMRTVGTNPWVMRWKMDAIRDLAVGQAAFLPLEDGQVLKVVRMKDSVFITYRTLAQAEKEYAAQLRRPAPSIASAGIPPRPWPVPARRPASPASPEASGPLPRETSTPVRPVVRPSPQRPGPDPQDARLLGEARAFMKTRPPVRSKQQALPDILKALKHPNPYVREFAFRRWLTWDTPSFFAQPDWEAIYRAGLRDGHGAVRVAAVRNIEKNLKRSKPGDGMVEKVARLADDLAATLDDPDAVRWAAAALGRIRPGPRAVAKLAAAYRRHRDHRDGYVAVQLMAAIGAARSPGDDVLAFCREVLRDLAGSQAGAPKRSLTGDVLVAISRCPGCRPSDARLFADAIGRLDWPNIYYGSGTDRRVILDAFFKVAGPEAGAILDACIRGGRKSQWRFVKDTVNVATCYSDYPFPAEALDRLRRAAAEGHPKVPPAEAYLNKLRIDVDLKKLSPSR